MVLTTLHIVYIAMVVAILGIMLMKKDIIIPCIIGIFVIGLIRFGNVVSALQAIFNAVIYAGTEFWGIIVTISLVVAMSKALQELGADSIMMSPIKKVMVNKNIAFFAVGLTMMVISYLVWPSPATALVGAVLLPAAVQAGLSPMYVAVAMNLFGHGIALSSDFFIQGAPSISAKGAGITAPEVMAASVPLWVTMAVVTVAVAFFMMLREQKKKGAAQTERITVEHVPVIEGKKKLARIVAILVPAAFLADIAGMLVFKLAGGDATALVGGTAVVLTLLMTLLMFKPKEALDKAGDYLKDGFGFGMRVFVPVLFIGGFFFIGNQNGAVAVLGEGAPAILNDISLYIADHVQMSKFTAIATQTAVSIITGLDGSGFSGLPIVGTLAYTFSQIIKVNIAGLTALGQILTVWADGGTIIPWAVIPVAAICGVSAQELARKNLIPVLCGMAATVIVAIFIL
ncbi:MAG TPA: hypothetical protein VN512_07955 [Clostridia bacterium]|nr:hypothetical protein [Clostridia bacterium]